MFYPRNARGCERATIALKMSGSAAGGGGAPPPAASGASMLARGNGSAGLATERWTTGKPTSATFSFYSDREIEALSVKQIESPVAFDSLGHAVPGYVLERLRLTPSRNSRDVAACMGSHYVLWYVSLLMQGTV